MGYAIAEEARDRGAEVTLICGATSLTAPFGVKVVSAKTNEEMLKEVLDRFNEQDIVIKAAAVADYKPKQYSNKKIKKAEEELNLTFTKDNDILKKLGSLKKSQILVGFAAESNDLLENAQKKLNNKNLDYIVANDITAADTGFASDNNKVTIICRDGKTINLDKMSKRQVASRLFDLINV
jgi:phosphopantothenoylcysteine decarboxylase/phosphopantothenate--cysteine ligase